MHMTFYRFNIKKFNYYSYDYELILLLYELWTINSIFNHL